jgi:hypothetical protein
MNRRDVPQDEIAFFAGQKKAVYALDEDGHYTLAVSSGWEVEEIVTRQALDELARQRRQALIAHRAGRLSPLPYHMYDKKMDIATLARQCGFWQWRVRRHYKPDVFKKLPTKVLAAYAEVLGITLSQLQNIDDARD